MLFKKLFGPKCLKTYLTNFFKTSWNSKDHNIEVTAASVAQAIWLRQNISTALPYCTQRSLVLAYMVDSGGAECLNSEITIALSTMSETGLNSERTEVPTTSVKQQFFFKLALLSFYNWLSFDNSKYTEDTPDDQRAYKVVCKPLQVESSPARDSPKMESLRTVSTPSSPWNTVCYISLFSFFCLAAAGTFEGIRYTWMYTI